ncbi:MAG: AbrB/MazE/SpoVT family DNA-binding domain-containing protein [Nitrososphaeraceae archaeon]
MKENQKVRFTYLTGKLSATLIIPLEVAKKNGLNKPSDVIVEETENGILIKKKSKM